MQDIRSCMDRSEEISLTTFHSISNALELLTLLRAQAGGAEPRVDQSGLTD